MAGRRLVGYGGGWRVGAVALLLTLSSPILPSVLAKVTVISAQSPRNRERPPRQQTRYIILHTTEAPAPSSLAKLKANGEANYFVDPGGKVYGLIDRGRVAYHCGRSMWKGRRDLDDVAIGIEVAGFHNRDISAAQYQALAELVAELQAIYGIADDAVLTHSMVAYGAPNRWHKRSHRGRKRCGMQFATSHVRSRLGLTARPKFDPDVRAGRLTVGDPYLAKVLYGGAQDRPVAPSAASPAPTAVVTAAVTPPPPPPPMPIGDPEGVVIGPGRSAWDIARDLYNKPETRYQFPDGRELRGDQVTNWKQMPPGTRVAMSVEEERENVAEQIQRIGRDGASAREAAGEEYNTMRTIYFLKDGRVLTGAEIPAAELDALPAETGMLVGYIQGGSISAKRRAFDVCGVKWNHPSTFYRFPDGRLIPGSEVAEKSIPLGTLVFFRN
jgi:hypothetical protein